MPPVWLVAGGTRRPNERARQHWKPELDCSEVWLSGKEIEFRQPGRTYNLEGVWQKQTPRS